jgi:aspartate/methionine/tyrosine aminotransferase
VLAAKLPAVTLLEPGGGWSVVLRFPRVIGEEALVLALLERHGVAAHPGYFFDFPSEGYLILSLLPDPRTFVAGLELTLSAIAARL